ncbi:MULTISPECIES: nucleoside triphosphate pyrophosphatase [Sorangium]|uniref:dTTP/UTP pyrophosphatase n=1 Tax=Sorangium cellulosum TaxID=56 RepID=A0A4P2QXM8_SORCE|nr:septum formation inhibitor Maf [Sorangium cellulosum]WCQ94624.1 dTTP/UTP pyrophosphatase [Sorangium sp. Soce836]
MIDDAHPLLLGSGSPRRREILTTLGLPLRVAAAEVDEAGRPEEGAAAYLERVTLAKLAAARRLQQAVGAGAILVADTSVILGDSILGKPRDEGDARAMLRALSGREHQVWTRFAIAGAEAELAPAVTPGRAEALHAETVVTRVRFRELDDDEVASYAATGEGLDKAGAYAIQGIGAFAVAGIEGSYSNVVGLPACEVVAALRAAGLLARFPLSPARSS